MSSGDNPVTVRHPPDWVDIEGEYLRAVSKSRQLLVTFF